MITAEQRAKELAQFFGMTETEALAKLKLGFGYHHAEVTADWKRANPQTDDEILEWYRKTSSYCWELSSYHLDERFTYMEMCAGISEALRAKGVNRALCLGDGIGDLTIKLRQDGIEAVYHDMPGSQTAQFADQRMTEYLGHPHSHEFDDPKYMRVPRGYDAIVSLDFLEHVKSVPDWTKEIYASLRPGGYMMCQNAFACGSGPDGSIPMHLSENDIYEKTWDPLCSEIGFVQISSNWYQRPL